MVRDKNNMECEDLIEHIYIYIKVEEGVAGQPAWGRLKILYPTDKLYIFFYYLFLFIIIWPSRR